MLYLSVIVPFIVYFIPIENKKLKILLSIAPAMFIILFRWGLGTDYFSYEYVYNTRPTTSFLEVINMNTGPNSMELGFITLIYIFNKLQLPFQVFVATISLTIYLFFVKWIIDSDQNYLFSIMLFNGMFFIVWVLSGLRQGLVLAIGTYFFLNKKVELNKLQSFILIMILGQIHVSAYIYFVVILIKFLKLNRKKLILLLSISLLFTLIPFNIVNKIYSNIPFIEKYLGYLSHNLGFWDFPGLIRLSFAGFILYYYYLFKKDHYMEMLANMSIIGFALYFLLKAAENVASRINVFTFVLIIPLIIYFINNKFRKKSYLILASVSLLAFSLVYLEKDLISHQAQVKKISIDKIYKLNLYQKNKLENYGKYNNRFSFYTYQQRLCNKQAILNDDIKMPTKNNGLVVVKDLKSDLYGIIDDTGQWFIKPKYESAPKIYKDIIIIKTGVDNFKYLNLDQIEIEVKEEEIQKYEDLSKEISDHEPIAKLRDLALFENDLKEFFPDLSQITETAVFTYKQPFSYEMLRIKTQYRNYYFLLTKDWEIHPKLLFTDPIIFDLNNIAVLSTFCNNVIINSEGNIIWTENN